MPTSIRYPTSNQENIQPVQLEQGQENLLEVKKCKTNKLKKRIDNKK